LRDFFFLLLAIISLRFRYFDMVSLVMPAVVDYRFEPPIAFRALVHVLASK